ncbi:LAFE_0E09230g1_1 [Lachancea fermentati]|uniref:LAFE_0E09230g1_1 n=1 Tax=Lachancea fermentati TaxID=4955 RepID=A0A1G4MDC1_LACFM|nr:LAFE_0E09230g1_1 [Lachancea fermentati]
MQAFRLARPKAFKVTIPKYTLTKYCYSTRSRNINDSPSFKKIALVGVIGTVIFVQAVKSLDKSKPKNTYSEEEFENVMMGLRRRVALFPAGQLKLTFIAPGVSMKKVAIEKDAKLISPREVVEYYRSLPNDKYQALLEDIRSSHDPETYFYDLPKGLLVMLIGRYMKENCKTGDAVYIVDFPKDIQDAIKFENEVCVVDKLYVGKTGENTDLAKYYQTVNKVESV